METLDGTDRGKNRRVRLSNDRGKDRQGWFGDEGMNRGRVGKDGKDRKRRLRGLRGEMVLRKMLQYELTNNNCKK